MGITTSQNHSITNHQVRAVPLTDNMITTAYDIKLGNMQANLKVII